MDNIANKTDGVDTLPDFEFNSHKNELQDLVTESGQTLAIGTTDQLRKAISIFGRALYAQDSSGAANTLTLSRPTALTDVNAYYNGLTLVFDTPNTNTGATTATFNGLASKKVRTAADADIAAGDILSGFTYTLVYNTALDSAAGAFELKKTGIPVASTAEAQALTDNTKSITPLRLNEALQGANQSLAANGYQKLPGGLIIQWGSAGQVNASSGVNVTFPLTFPTAVVSFSPSGESQSDAADGFINYDNLTTSSARITNGFNDFMVSANWVAIGY